jgi:hypothetical protein
VPPLLPPPALSPPDWLDPLVPPDSEPLWSELPVSPPVWLPDDPPLELCEGMLLGSEGIVEGEEDPWLPPPGEGIEGEPLLRPDEPPELPLLELLPPPDELLLEPPEEPLEPPEEDGGEDWGCEGEGMDEDWPAQPPMRNAETVLTAVTYPATTSNRFHGCRLFIALPPNPLRFARLARPHKTLRPSG